MHAYELPAAPRASWDLLDGPGSHCIPVGVAMNAPQHLSADDPRHSGARRTAPVLQEVSAGAVVREPRGARQESEDHTHRGPSEANRAAWTTSSEGSFSMACRVSPGR